MQVSRPSRQGSKILWFTPTVLLICSSIGAYGASESQSGGVTVIPDWSVFIQIANFIFLIWVLNLILYRPIRDVLIQRKQKLSGLEESIESFSRDLEEKEEAFDAGIKEARARGRSEKEVLLAAAAEEEKNMITKIHEKAQADLSEVRDKIVKDAEEVRKSLLLEIDAFAQSISEKILGRKVS